MTGAGSILWILAIGALVFFMFRKGGGCCGTGGDKDHSEHTGHCDTEKKEQDKGGGCCG